MNHDAIRAIAFGVVAASFLAVAYMAIDANGFAGFLPYYLSSGVFCTLTGYYIAAACDETRIRR